MISCPLFAASKDQVKLSPAKVKQINKINKGYRDCQKAILSDIKSGKLPQTKAKIALNNCKERFPGASLYTDCKKEALKNQNIKDGGDRAVECKRFLTAASFDPAEPIPFFTKGTELFFAGIGLNKPVAVDQLNLPNFTCDRLKEAVATPAKVQFLLFGNHLQTFKGFAEIPKAKLNQLVNYKPKAKQQDVVGLGRIYDPPSNDKSMLFFPTAPCDFNGQTGNTFAGLSAHYIVNNKAKMVVPYFAIAYYRTGQRTETTTTLATGLQKRFGDGYKIIKKNSYTQFIAATPFNVFDSEGDPRNLCAAPRSHSFIGISQGNPQRPEQPEYLIVANIVNLCDYGDHLSSRFGK